LTFSYDNFNHIYYQCCDYTVLG